MASKNVNSYPDWQYHIYVRTFLGSMPSIFTETKREKNDNLIICKLSRKKLNFYNDRGYGSGTLKIPGSTSLFSRSKGK